MFFHKFHFICCELVDDPTGKQRKTFLGFFGQFQFCPAIHSPEITQFILIRGLKVELGAQASRVTRRLALRNFFFIL
jgi:hypothetical protein